MLTKDSLVRQIKLFTQKSPNIEDKLNPAYKRYLAKCSKLFELDIELSNMSENQKDEDYYLRLEEIKNEIEMLTRII